MRFIGMKRFIVLTGAAIFIGLLISSCKVDKEFTVTFNSNEGSEVSSQIVRDGGLVTKPSPDPTRDGFIFVAWYKESSFMNQWDFDVDVVTGNTTLYARWQEHEPDKFLVEFESNGGSTIAPQNVTEMEKITKPSDPTRDGFIFVAWYKEPSFTNQWDFDVDVVTGNTMLYARWHEHKPDKFLVEFESNGGSTIASQKVAEMEKITKPSDPIRSGYVFVAWYFDADFRFVWDFDMRVVTSDIKLYAKWRDEKLDLQVSEVISSQFELGSLQKILDGIHVRVIEFDSKGNAWIGTFDHGIIRYNAEETIFFDAESIIPGGFTVWDISIDNNDNVWIGVSGNEFEFGVGSLGGGLLKYDGQEFTLYNSKNTPMPLDHARFIEIDSHNNIWFVCSNVATGGLVKYDGAEWTVFTTDNSVLPYSNISSIAIDQSDNVWLGVVYYMIKITNSGEWKIYTPEEWGFTQFYHWSGAITDIKINSNNHLVVAIDYRWGHIPYPEPDLLVMFVFDGEKTNEFVLWENFASGVSSITFCHKGYVWCTYDWGIAYGSSRYGVWFGGERGGLIDGRIIDDQCGELLPYITIIKEAPDHTIWFGTGHGIVIMTR